MRHPTAGTGLRSALLVLAVPMALAPVAVRGAEQGSFAVSVEAAVKVPMRDGVQLLADVYSPKAEGRFPVLLQRTPYNRRTPATGVRLASHGYVVVLQDTRGRYDSEGEFYPFRDEASDGFDTVEWAASLQGSDGRVGMFGGSYVGATQMLAASAAPPHLAAIFPYVTASEYYEGWTYESGALMQFFASSWSSGLAEDTVRRKLAGRGPQMRSWLGALPVDAYPIVRFPTAAEAAPYFRDWVEHERDDEYWRRWKVSDRYGAMTVKGLHAAGWHDIFQRGSIGNYLGMREGAATPEARAGQRLIVGPWAHWETSKEGKVGDVVFGPSAYLDMDAEIVRWFDFAIKGQPNVYAKAAPVRLFVMGENVWREEQEFPPARAVNTRYFLHSQGAANTVAGNGSLSTEQPAQESPDRFTYDPENPVPTLGGRLCCGAELLPGPFDQRPNERREDVLVYSTPPLERDLEVTGFVSVELHAASTAVDTDFTALLADVDPSGYSRFLVDGIVRARFRSGTDRAQPIEPGRVYPLVLELGATGNVFKAGHRLRLYVSSSNFPRFNRNLNTGEPTLGGSRVVRASQLVYHDPEHPSAIVLPVVPR
jgi:putative CocE/NonD family hydrolase